MSQPLIVYMTFSSQSEAEKISRMLVSEKLVACANIFPKVKSIYEWEGKIENTNESVVIAKTIKKNMQKLIKRVKKLHSYSCPCIVALPFKEGNKEFIKWVSNSLK